jgi:hypothetical protein
MLVALKVIQMPGWYLRTRDHHHPAESSTGNRPSDWFLSKEKDVG